MLSVTHVELFRAVGAKNNTMDWAKTIMKKLFGRSFLSIVTEKTISRTIVNMNQSDPTTLLKVERAIVVEAPEARTKAHPIKNSLSNMRNIVNVRKGILNEGTSALCAD